MSGKPAARHLDPVTHPLPPVLTGVPTTPNVLIGYKPVWKGVPAGVASSLKAAQKAAETTGKFRTPIIKYCYKNSDNA